MTTINKTALVPYSASEMYALVNDIGSYSQFLPWCRSTRVLTEIDNHVVATVDIDFKGVRQSFTTQNLLAPSERIEMRLLKGPFRHLHGIWRFRSLDELACKVALEIEFEFASRLLGAAIGPVFERITNGLVEAFHERARSCYGPR